MELSLYDHTLYHSKATTPENNCQPSLETGLIDWLSLMPVSSEVEQSHEINLNVLPWSQLNTFGLIGLLAFTWDWPKCLSVNWDRRSTATVTTCSFPVSHDPTVTGVALRKKYEESTRTRALKNVVCTFSVSNTIGLFWWWTRTRENVKSLVREWFY